MEMLFDGMFVPEERSDGTIVWANPASMLLSLSLSLSLSLLKCLLVVIGNGKIPLISVLDAGEYVLWIFDNIERSAGMDLEVATDQVSFKDIVEVFTKVTGKPAIHVPLAIDEYMARAEPYPNAPVNYLGGKNKIDDESNMTWRENFTAWWRYWSEGIGATRDFELLTEIFPGRIKSLEEWMYKVNYQGRPKPVLKDLEDLRSEQSGTEHPSHGH
jgi:hypothetical protein